MNNAVQDFIFKLFNLMNTHRNFFMPTCHSRFLIRYFSFELFYAIFSFEMFHSSFSFIKNFYSRCFIRNFYFEFNFSNIEVHLVTVTESISNYSSCKHIFILFPCNYFTQHLENCNFSYQSLMLTQTLNYINYYLPI